MVAQPGLSPNSVVLAAPVLGLGSIGWVPGGLGVVEGEEIPYQPWAAARKKENLEHWMDRDPEIKCFQPGVPRAMYMPYPFQIIQSATKVMMVFEYANAAAHDPPEQDGTVSERGVHGIFGRPLGRRYAGRRRHGFHGRDVVRPVREFPQRRAARGRAIHADGPRRDPLRSHDRGSAGIHAARGRSACRSIAGWSRMRS